MYTCIRVYTCIYINTQICVYTYMCIHTYTQICVPYRSDRHAYSCFNHIYDKHVNTYPDRLQHDFLIRAPSLNPVRNMTFSYV